MRCLVLSLLILITTSYTVRAEQGGAGQGRAGQSQLQDAERRRIWAKEIGRWSAYCITRRNRENLVFYGCPSRLTAIRSTAAVYRMNRLSGYPKEASRLVDMAQLKLWIGDPKFIKELSSLERSSLIDLAREGLQATGHSIWYKVLTQAMLSSQWFRAITCSLESSCAIELISMIKASQLLKESIGHFTESQSETDHYLLARSPVLLSSARHLSRPHPRATLSTDDSLKPTHSLKQAHSLWSLRAQLAALSLSVGNLDRWWRDEQGAMKQFSPLSSLGPKQYGVNFERMLALGSALVHLQVEKSPGSIYQEISKSFHAHARIAMEQYLKYRRSQRQYTFEVSSLGVIALTADLEEMKLPLTFPPRRWRSGALRVSPHQLPSSEIRASGMFSEIAIRDLKGRRGLYFIRPNGAQLLETELDLSRPDILQVKYTQDMLAVYPLLPQRPIRALLVGLGGGAMVHALRAYDPQLDLDVVEIDPVVVRFAREHFGLKALENERRPHLGELRVITEDGFAFLATTSEAPRYDIIWMDAFLQPSEETDSTGSPLNLKTVSFLKRISAERLTDQGVIAININHHRGLKRDIDTVRASFPTSTVWQVPNTGNYIAVGFKRAPQLSTSSLRAKAHSITTSQQSPFSYLTLLERSLAGMIPPLPIERP